MGTGLSAPNAAWIWKTGRKGNHMTNEPQFCNICWDIKATLTLVDSDGDRLYFCDDCYDQMSDDLEGNILPAEAFGISR